MTPSVFEEDDNILMQDNHTISMEQLNNNKTKDKPWESAPSKIGVDTNVKETYVYYNSQSCLIIIRKKCLNSKQQDA